MKNLILVFFAICSPLTFGQGVAVNFSPVLSSIGPIPFVQIHFCTTPTVVTSGVCSTPVTVYQNITLTSPYSSAIQTDGLGNFPTTYFTPAANYCYSLSGFPAATNMCYAFSAPIIPGYAFAGPSPWFDVTSIKFGAKCDGATNDTAAIQAAFTAAKAVGAGAFVYFPPSSSPCVITGQVNIDNANGIRFGGLGGSLETLGLPSLLYSGTASPAISCKTCISVVAQNIRIGYTNPSFTGTVIDMTGLAGGANVFSGVLLAGLSTAKSATTLIDFTNSVSNKVYNSSFGWTVNAITATNSNVLTISDSYFDVAGQVISGAYILNPTEGSKITGNTFEMLSAPNTAVVLDSSSIGCFGCDFSGNWIGDHPAGWTGTALKLSGNWTVNGNTLRNVAGGTIISLGSAHMLSMEGNSGGLGTLLNMNGGGQPQVNIGENNWGLGGALGTFMTAGPAGGRVTDNANTTTYYGVQTFNSTSTLTIPASAGLQPVANGRIAYDSTANRFGGGHNGAYAAFVTPTSADIFTNKSFDTAGPGNFFKIAGSTVSATSGSGSVLALAASANFTTPTIGGGSTLNLYKTATDSPGAITVNAQTCTDRGVAIAGSLTGAVILPTANYALESNLSLSPGQTVAGTAHYRICNGTAGNITLNAASTFNLAIIQ